MSEEISENSPAWAIDAYEASQNWEEDNAESAEERASRLLDDLRFERNVLLAKTDWWAVSDRTMTEAQLAYRQALRDITETYTSLDDVVWPEEP